MEIVGRYHRNGDKLPKMILIKDTPQKEQEFIDAQKLKNWNKFLKVRFCIFTEYINTVILFK